MYAKDVDYSLYLVTDSGMVPEGLSFLEQVEKSIANGATVVQLREKSLDTGDFIRRAEKVHQLTLKAGIPLIINDRVDVALAIDAEGVHVGQDDMPVQLARKLMGADKIVGLSCSYPEEAVEAIKSGVVDYVGIGAVYDTATKKNLRREASGPVGVREILTILRDQGGMDIKSVAIGGLNTTNSNRVLYQSSIPGKSLDGVAVVSCIMAKQDAASATKLLLDSIRAPVPWLYYESTISGLSTSEVVSKIRSIKPLIHHITNGVVKNFSANVTLAIGGSPAMSELDEEFPAFSRFPNVGLLLNTGTPSASQVTMYIKALQAYNAEGRPIVFDPVAAGASPQRKAAVATLLKHGQMSVIKGNAGEIAAVAGGDSKMRGVDSLSTNSVEELIELAKKVAIDYRCVVVVTGKTDIIVDGIMKGQSVSSYDIPSANKLSQKYVTVEGGHYLMGEITGSGCSLGSVIATFITLFPGDIFEATVKAVQVYKTCGESAGKLCEDKGPGSFAVEFINALYNYK